MAMAAGTGSSAMGMRAIPYHESRAASSPPMERRPHRQNVIRSLTSSFAGMVNTGQVGRIVVNCSAGDSSSSVSTTTATQAEQNGEGMSWAAVIPVSALPKGERRLVRQDDQDVLLLWYKGEVVAIENTSPAEGAYSEGFVNAKLTQDGCIVCPSTESTFDLKTGEIKEWFPSNPVLRLLTPPLRKLTTYPVKIDSDYIYISTQSSSSVDSAEIVFGGQVQAGRSAPNVEVEEVRMVVDEGEMGFGFSLENELLNGRSAMMGFTVLLIFELITGKGFLKGIGFLDFLYRFLPNFPIIKKWLQVPTQKMVAVQG
ncbi:hypothetical protein GOP47_0020483 [Adiantum capillus-veneris]|uniref:Rieske domain-containing protein n=1 Tax=Adiantum capillus-veneris TaxID=13818 RepID=A0A9D4UA58_ADICA|nr:hypothetical protein GOP47_0020483 [Adiantum capillus-veneris]